MHTHTRKKEICFLCHFWTSIWAYLSPLRLHFLHHFYYFQIQKLSLPICQTLYSVQFSSVQSLSCVQLFVTPWPAVCQASLSIQNDKFGRPWTNLSHGHTESIPIYRAIHPENLRVCWISSAHSIIDHIKKERPVTDTLSMGIAPLMEQHSEGRAIREGPVCRLAGPGAQYKTQNLFS